MKYKSHPNINLTSHVYKIYKSFLDDEQHRTVAFFHDLGKIADEFQRYINKESQSKTTHAFESSFFYFLLRYKKDDFENFLANLCIVYKHHKDLPDIKNEIENNFNFTFDGFIRYFFEKLSNRSTKEINKKLFRISNSLSLFYSQGEIDKKLKEFLYFYKYELLENKKYIFSTIDEYFLFKIRFSKLIFADKYEAIFHTSYKPEKSFEPQKYIDKLEDLIVKKNEENKIDLNNNRNKARIEILENYQSNRSRKIFIIEAPTGIGKTLAALRLALEIAKNENKQTIITALPFTSIIEQTHSEYRQIFEDNILLKYHHLTDNKQYISDTEQNQNLQKNDYIASTWAFDDVIVTTFNQLFYTIFSNKNRDLTKFWRLENSVIILDEIQSIPRVLLKDVAETLAFLSEAYNIHFILMSATIPAIKEFLGKESYAELLSEEYYKGNERYTIVPNFNMSFEGLKKEIRDKSKTQSVLCVVNTKKLASKIFEDLQDLENIHLLSTNLIPKHRKIKIQCIRRQLKKKRQDKKLAKVVLISTQMVEAGVDLDFDTGFREFAPFGSIIQTAGRINRNNRKKENQDFELVVFELSDHPNLEDGKSKKTHPYHHKDMLEDKKDVLFGNAFNESKILGKIKLYFKEAIDRTILLDLQSKMKKLEFESVFQEFEKNFMSKIPNLVPVFVEIKSGLVEDYKNEKIELLRESREVSDLSKKMEIKTKLKKLEKEMSQYIVEVSEKDKKQLQPMFDSKEFQDFTNIHICPFEDVGKRYSYEKGWDGEYWDYGFLTDD